MALKDHSLDEKIIKAARDEFLQHGFMEASLRKIAEKAGITTGALYTRYKNKDVLFCSLVSSVTEEIGRNFGPVYSSYMSVKASPDAEKIMEVIKKEEKIYLDIMFKYYDECILIFCRSDGSSLQKQIKRMTENKARETVEYLKSVSKKDFDSDGIEFIVSEQFHYYREILEKNYSREKTMKCIKSVEDFLDAGWKNLFDKIL